MVFIFMMKKFLLIPLFFAALCLCAQSLKTGMPVKALPSPVYLDGSTHKLSDFLGKKFVALYLWEPNQAALSEFSTLPGIVAQCKDSADFIGIGVGSLNRLKKFPGAAQLGFPVNVDVRNEVKKLFLRNGDSTPMVILLDKSGTLIWRGPVKVLPRILKDCASGKFDLKEQIRVEVFTDAVNEAIRAEKYDAALPMLKEEYRRNPRKLELLRVQLAILKKLQRFEEAFAVLHEAQKLRPRAYRIFEMEYKLIGESGKMDKLPEFFTRLKTNFAKQPGVLLGFAISECQLPPAMLNLEYAVDLVETGWKSNSFSSDEEKGLYALDYAKILHSIGRNDLAAILARRAQALLKKSPKNIGKADSAFLYYTKMMKIAPKVTLSL